MGSDEVGEEIQTSVDKSTQVHTANGKFDFLEDMATSIIHVLNDTDYLRIYYPAENAVRNKGNLTLISP